MSDDQKNVYLESAHEDVESDSEQCPECHGSGLEGILPDDTEVPCPFCQGTGQER